MWYSCSQTLAELTSLISACQSQQIFQFLIGDDPLGVLEGAAPCGRDKIHLLHCDNGSAAGGISVSLYDTDGIL